MSEKGLAALDRLTAHIEALESERDALKAELEKLKHQKLDETLVKTIADRDHWRTLALQAKEALERAILHCPEGSVSKREGKNVLAAFPPEEKKP